MNMRRGESFICNAGSKRQNPFIPGVMILAGLLIMGNTTRSAEAELPAREEKADKAADFLRDYHSDFIIIKGKGGAGSGFVFARNGRKFLASNAHVIAGIKSPMFTSMDRTPLKFKPGAASLAIGHDIILLEVQEGGKGMPVAESFENEVAVNDPIAVYGNPGGGDVVTVIKGRLVGIGPNRIEISAEIEHGNSGSPIVHVRSGRVIGVATYATTYDLLSGEKTVRRFGYRLDTVKQWQAVDWGRFYAEADNLQKIQDTTTELAKAFLELNGLNQRTNKVRVYAYESPVIRNALDNFYRKLDVLQNRNDADRAVNNLLGTLRSASRAYPTAIKPTFTYDYFRRQFTDLESDRVEVMKLFEKIFQK